MKTLLSRVLGLPVVGPGGPLGTVQDFYFDEGRWVVRFVLCQSPIWTGGRSVLVPVRYFLPRTWDLPVLPVSLSQDQTTGLPRRERLPIALRSFRKVRRFQLRPARGLLGRCQDFVVEGHRWTVRSLLVKANRAGPPLLVLARADLVEEISEEDRTLLLDSDDLQAQPAPPYL
jgi:hypothetical protein